MLYADDSVISFVHRNVNVISKKISKVLESCSDWLIDNRLSLHLGKTECMLFGPPRKLKQIPVSDFYVKCYDTVIKSTNVVKYLGIHIDQFMKFDDIVDSIVIKVISRLKFLYRNAKCLDMNTRLTLCTAFIQCQFDYASSAWFSSVGKTMLKKLQICQNKVVRFIFNLEPRTSITQEILDKVKMLRVPVRVSQLKLNHVFNIANDLAPSYLCQILIFNQGRTRSTTNRNFIIPSMSQCIKNSFVYCANFKTCVKEH